MLSTEKVVQVKRLVILKPIYLMAIELEEKLIALKVVFIYLGKITHFLFSIIYLVLYAKI